jgi:hypothetical protein
MEAGPVSEPHGSGIGALLADRGTHQVPGAADPWPLFAVGGRYRG